MVDPIDNQEEKFYPFLIIGSYVSEKGLDNKRRAGIAYQIEDRNGNLINKENKYIGAKEIHTKKYAESIALLEGIRYVKQHLPVGSTDIRIRTDSTNLVEHLYDENDSNEKRRLPELARSELSSLWAWGARRESEKVSTRISSMNKFAELSLPASDQTYVSQ